MKVAFCIRPDYSTLLGGDVVQMLKTREFLEKNYGVEIVIVTLPEEINENFDIIHVFNFSTYHISRKFIEQALKFSIPVISSPIYWDYSYASIARLFSEIPKLNQLTEFTVAFLKTVSRFMAHVIGKPEVISPAFKQNAKWMFGNSDFVAPNSSEEANLLLKWIKTEATDKIRIVYNATDRTNNQVDSDAELFHKKYNIPTDYILQVGRIEFCKNQLNLVSALKNDREIPIVFVGKITDRKYFRKVKDVADKRGNVFFINAVPYDEIGAFYRFARLHVLLSLRESPGLVSIESLANGCPIVISDDRFLPVNTYFQTQPYIANPLNVKDIRKVVLDAYQNRKIEPFDFEKFSWNTVSEQTFRIYNEILNK